MSSPPDPEALLLLLGTVLTEKGWHAQIRKGSGRPVRLHVRNPNASGMSDDIGCDGERFFWSHGLGVGPVTEVIRAADQIRYVLREVTS